MVMAQYTSKESKNSLSEMAFFTDFGRSNAEVPCSIVESKGALEYQKILIIFRGFSSTKLSYRTGFPCGPHSLMAHIRLTSIPPCAGLQ